FFEGIAEFAIPSQGGNQTKYYLTFWMK
ncbi:MAG: hypothetical protein RLZZ458_2911, partial [Planctomycetota bacterium]